MSSIKCARMSLGPRPMYSCSKRLMPSQMAASISPCVFMVAQYRSLSRARTPDSVCAARASRPDLRELLGLASIITRRK